MGGNNLCGCARTPQRAAFSPASMYPWSWLCRVNASWSTPSFPAQPIRRVTVELWCIWKGCLVSEASGRSGTPREALSLTPFALPCSDLYWAVCLVASKAKAGPWFVLQQLYKKHNCPITLCLQTKPSSCFFSHKDYLTSLFHQLIKT